MSGSGACRDQYDSWLDDLPAEYAEDIEKVDECFTVGDYDLQIEGHTDDVHVWLKLNGYGIAIGGGESRAEAVTDAIETLERALGVLRERG